MRSEYIQEGKDEAVQFVHKGEKHKEGRSSIRHQLRNDMKGQSSDTRICGKKLNGEDAKFRFVLLRCDVEESWHNQLCL